MDYDNVTDNEVKIIIANGKMKKIPMMKLKIEQVKKEDIKKLII